MARTQTLTKHEQPFSRNLALGHGHSTLTFNVGIHHWSSTVAFNIDIQCWHSILAINLGIRHLHLTSTFSVGIQHYRPTLAFKVPLSAFGKYPSWHLRRLGTISLDTSEFGNYLPRRSSLFLLFPSPEYMSALGAKLDLIETRRIL